MNPHWGGIYKGSIRLRLEPIGFGFAFGPILDYMARMILLVWFTVAGDQDQSLVLDGHQSTLLNISDTVYD